MLKLRLLTVLLISITLAGCIRQDTPDDGKFLVKEVVDGDTILLADGRKVRYIGIDTPETMRKTSAGWVSDPEPYGNEAKKYNMSLVSGSRVRLEYDKDRYDKYGRTLAYVYTDNGLLANEEIVREGLAKLLTIPPNTKHVTKFYAAASEAKEARRGIWS